MLRLYTQPGRALDAKQGHKHPIEIGLTLRLDTSRIAVYTNYLGTISVHIIQQEHKLSFKPNSIQYSRHNLMRYSYQSDTSSNQC